MNDFKIFQIQCSNGQTGYGRRKREVRTKGDSNKIFEINLTTFIKVDWDENSLNKNSASELEKKIEELKIANQKLARNSRAENVFESIQATRTNMDSNNDDSAKVEETIIFTKEIVENSQSILGCNMITTLVLPLFSIILVRYL